MRPFFQTALAGPFSSAKGKAPEFVTGAVTEEDVLRWAEEIG